MHLLYLLNDLVKVAMAHGPHCGCNQVIEMRRHQSFQKRSALLQEDLAGIGHCASLKRKAVEALVNQQKESANGLGPEYILHWVFLLDARDNSNATNHGVNQLNNLLIQEIITKLCIDVQSLP